MKSTGIVREIDTLGRIVLPIELRRTFDISPKDPIEVYTEGELIVLKKFQNSCLFCGETEGLVDYKEKYVCPDCLKILNNKKID